MREMLPRERVITALHHEEPDRVPLDIGGDQTGINVECYRRLVQYLGMDEDVTVMHHMGQVARMSEAMLQRFDVDTRYVFPMTAMHAKPEIGEQTMEDGREYFVCTDEWGIVRAMPKEGGHWYDIIVHPLAEATMADLDRYPWPNPRNPSHFDGLREHARLLAHTDYALATGVIGPFFEMCLYLCGFERALTAFAADRPFMERLLDILLQYWQEFADAFLAETGEYLQVVNLGDDLASQQAPLISPKTYRELVKPRQKELFDFVHQRTDAKLWLHCCGAIYPLISDLIEIGVDILNPVQVAAKGMDSRRLKAEFGERLTFWGGGCDTQSVLPFGTTKDVEDEVRRRIADLGPGGGFVFSAVHDIPVETPPENVVAMVNAVRQYGHYPLT